MYPLLLKSPCKNELWGGNKIYGMFKAEEYEDASELWLLSADANGESTVKNGELKDLTVSETVQKYGKIFYGTKYDTESVFPALIKLCDAKDSLPLGVSTRERLIYIKEAQRDAQIIFGFSRDTSEEEIRQRINTNTLFSVCNYCDVKKGDIINIPSGTLFAVGKDVLFYEVRYGDEEFYPVSDYGRTDKSGNRLPLKREEALGIMNFSAAPQFAARFDDTFLYPFGTVTEFPAKDGISVSLIRLSGSAGISESESFVSCIIADGSAAVSYPSGTINMKMGDSLLIPAKMRVKFTGFADIICTHL